MGKLKSFLRIHYASTYLFIGWLACYATGKVSMTILALCGVFIVLNYGMEASRRVMEQQNISFRKAFFWVETIFTSLLTVLAVVVLVSSGDQLGSTRLAITWALVSLMATLNISHFFLMKH